MAPKPKRPNPLKRTGRWIKDFWNLRKNESAETRSQIELTRARMIQPWKRIASVQRLRELREQLNHSRKIVEGELHSWPLPAQQINLQMRSDALVMAHIWAKHLPKEVENPYAKLASDPITYLFNPKGIPIGNIRMRLGGKNNDQLVVQIRFSAGGEYIRYANRFPHTKQDDARLHVTFQITIPEKIIQESVSLAENMQAIEETKKTHRKTHLRGK